MFMRNKCDKTHKILSRMLKIYGNHLVNGSLKSEHQLWQLNKSIWDHEITIYYVEVRNLTKSSRKIHILKNAWLNKT